MSILKIIEHFEVQFKMSIWHLEKNILANGSYKV